MTFISFNNYPLWVLSGVFAAAGVAVWIAGTKLSRYASIISDETGVGHALVGLLLLGGITSLPEIATSVTASVVGNAPLAVNNLIGGVAAQVVVLAIGDLFIRRNALTGRLPRPHVVIQAALSIILLVLVAAGIVIGDVMLLGFGAWSLAILLAYLLTLWIARSSEGRVVWVLKEAEQRLGSSENPDTEGDGAEDGGSDETSAHEGEKKGTPLRPVMLKTLAAALVILAAGFLLTRTGEALAEVTGLGQSFFGAVFLAFSTSLPELSSVISAVRLGHEMLAIGDVLGGNLFDVALVFVVDLIYEGGPVLNEVDTFSVAGALLGILLTTFYIIGMIERGDRAYIRMGPDSIAVLVCYAVGLVILYSLRPN
jgi:cation:H+ antiporter